MKPNPLRIRVRAVATTLFCVLFIASLLANCRLDDVPTLVPPTVVDDPGLPRREITVLGKKRLVHWRTSGNPTNPVLFVMPGSLSDVFCYRPFEQFSDTYYVVLWDQRGQGLSQRVDRGELGYDAMVEEIKAMKDALSPAKPISLLGHSWSAIFALLYAGKYPDDVTRLILMEPFGFTSEIMSKADAGVLNLFTPGYLDMAWFSGMAPLDSHDALDFRMRGMLTSGVRPFFKDPDHFPEWPVRRVGGLALLAWESALLEGAQWRFDFSPSAASVTARVLLVGSQYSYIGYDFQRTWNAPLFSKAASVETLLVPDSGHRMITENWNALKAGVGTFLGTQP
jgi:proline iminopeptidase